jgi:predicted nucleic acid-binding Zn ribbon protein
MPEYVYRREDGSTFSYRQRFSEDPLTIDPSTGQRVVRVVQNAGVIFKGSGFYVNDSREASKKILNGSSSEDKSIVKKTDEPKSIVEKTETPKSIVKSNGA